MSGPAAIRQIPTDNASVFAFAISGTISDADLQAMAVTMNAAFDVQDHVAMLLIFADYEGLETGAGLNAATIESQFRSLTHVDKYAVVGAPGAAATLIDMMDAIIPVDARTFDAADAQEAWRFVGASPVV